MCVFSRNKFISERVLTVNQPLCVFCLFYNRGERSREKAQEKKREKRSKIINSSYIAECIWRDDLIIPS